MKQSVGVNFPLFRFPSYSPTTTSTSRVYQFRHDRTLDMTWPAIGEAGDAGGVVLQTVLRVSFLLYFRAKAPIGLAGIGLGLKLWMRGSGTARLVGGAAVLVGLVAAAVNGFALPQGMAYVFPAGATGTAAALTTAAVLWLAGGQRSAR